ncbi:Chorion peroxidase [Orchesella cincta]|uniref:Chorion peroxidase n=1 Tax=Orchesella cincta TaxID=48709 RepID=A0A1D2MAN7_ORCCI|nr:Chorion peroxidase [Orchesella cincta]
MKSAIILEIFSVGLLISQVSSTINKTLLEEKILVENVIQVSASKYDERMKLAFLNGAHSKRNQRELKKSTKYTQEIGRIGNIYIDAFKELTLKHNLERSSAIAHLRQALPKECEQPTIVCETFLKYRTFNGTCNNLNNPHWGSINMPNARLLPPSYANEIDEPRGGLDQTSVPAVRNLTLTIHQGGDDKYENTATHMVPQFGQFLDHDITLTPVDDLQCCGSTAPDCWTIAVAPSDPFYGNRSPPVECLDFVRSSPVCFPQEGVEHREQMNIHSSYIDGGMIYGRDDALASILREYKNGRLVENSQYPKFLPFKKQIVPGDESDEVIAGDVRASEMPGLTVMHTLFLREHNRIADIFATLTSWDDEWIFQETRRIIIAELQQITYNEFLPSILGPEAMTNYDLALPPVTEGNGYTTYNSSVDATIISSFATAAYRFGHTLVNGLIQLMMDGISVGSYRVKDNYGVSNQVLQDYTSTNGSSGYDMILNGLTRQRSQAFDTEIHKDMSNELFKNEHVNFIGTDLSARNVQRGRDHGTPSYNSFRRFCNLIPLTTWNNRPLDISEGAWEKLRSVYETPQDIDFYTGGLSQTPVQDGLSGPTFVCVQALQFQRLMKGDRYFFTHANTTGSFTPGQLAALRSRRLGDIICQNSALKETARNVFYRDETSSNPMISCEDASRNLDISLFTN